MRLIAHRGFAAIAPENTLAAIRAADTHADAVEFDVRRCGSGELVVFHDPTLERVTGVHGTLSETPLEELRTLEVLDSGESIPTLEEALDAVPPGLEVNLEMKSLGIGEDVLAALEGVSNRVVATSFLTPELRRLHELDPSQPTGLLVSRRLVHPVTTAVELGCEVIGAHYWRCLTTGLVDRARALGLEIHSWTVERPLLAKLLAVRGVDYVSADRPLW